jgi:hypothetical protein
MTANNEATGRALNLWSASENKPKTERNEAVFAAVHNGATLQAVGNAHGLSTSRVSSIYWIVWHRKRRNGELVLADPSVISARKPTMADMRSAVLIDQTEHVTPEPD